MGIDPGTHVVGWGVIDVAGSRQDLVAAGAITAPASAPIHERLAIIARELGRIRVEYEPDEVAIEEVFHAKSARAAIRLGEGRGAAMAAMAGLPVAAYAANEVKKAVTGKGGRAKAHVARLVTIILGLDEIPEPVDATDALALALCHASRRNSPITSGASSAVKTGGKP
jgi:crossover junction endodeoxyribonuclease RuvC